MSKEIISTPIRSSEEMIEMANLRVAENTLNFNYSNYYGWWPEDPKLFSADDLYYLSIRKIDEKLLKKYLPEAEYTKLIVEGPRRREYGDYKPNQLVEHDLIDYLQDNDSFEKYLEDVDRLTKILSRLKSKYKKGVSLEEYKEFIESAWRKFE